MDGLDHYADMLDRDDEVVVGGLRVAIVLNGDGDEVVRFHRDGDLNVGPAMYALEVSKLMLFHAGDSEVENG